LNWITNLYPVWLIAISALAFMKPETMAWFNGPWIIWALTLVMLGMGFTLSVKDFQRLAKMPGATALGFVAQYTVMPLVGWGLAHLLGLKGGLAVGLILVASCPGGTASNVVSYLARANVALSVILTMASTLMAFIMTPLWCKGLAGQYVEVDAKGLCLSTLQVVVLPVLIGVFCNWRFPRSVAKVAQAGPLVSVIAIVMITGGIVAQSAASMAAHAGKLFTALVALHVAGFILGYAITRILRYPPDVARTVSIEVGMQNGGMAAMLAKRHFPADPLTAVPAVFSGILQNLLGSLIAAWWRARPLPPPEPVTGAPIVQPSVAEPS
jgi:BASS family bile acid:Na+ symporter